MGTPEHYRLKMVAEAPAYDEARGCLRIVASVEMPDRDDEVVVPSTLRLDAYRANPVVIWAHGQENWPIARCEDDAGTFTCRLDADGRLVQEWYFARTEEGRKAAELYRDRVLRGASIGFVSDGLEDVSPEEAERRYGVRKRLKRHLGGELLETSAVPVPACPGALALGWLDPPAALAAVQRGGVPQLITKALSPYLPDPRATAPPTLRGTETTPPATTDAARTPEATVSAATDTTTKAADAAATAKAAAVTTKADDAAAAEDKGDPTEEMKSACRKVAHMSLDKLLDAEDDEEQKGHLKSLKAAIKDYRKYSGKADQGDDDQDPDDTDLEKAEDEGDDKAEDDEEKAAEDDDEADAKAFEAIVRKAVRAEIAAALAPVNRQLADTIEVLDALTDD